MDTNFTPSQCNAIAQGQDKGLSAYFAYFQTPSNAYGEAFANTFIAHLTELCDQLDNRTRESAGLCAMPIAEAHLVNYAILSLHLMRYILRRNQSRIVEAERQLVDRVIDLFATRLEVSQIPEMELTTTLMIMRDDWIAAGQPEDLTLFLMKNPDRYAPTSCFPLIALSGGDVEGLIMTQILESTEY